MKNKLKFLAVALIAGGTMFAQPRISVGIGVGGYGPGYYAPPAYTTVVPPCPGPGYAWVDGYWVPEGGRRVWVNGFWRAPYVGGYAVGPGYYGRGFYGSGYYGGGGYRGYDRGHDYGRGFVSRGGFGHDGGHRR